MCSSLRNNDCEEDDHSAKTLLKILIPVPVSFTAPLNYTQPWVWARNWVTMAKLKGTVAIFDYEYPLSKEVFCLKQHTVSVE